LYRRGESGYGHADRGALPWPRAMVKAWWTGYPDAHARARRIVKYVYALAACAATTAIAVALLPWLDLANLVMLFLLNVVLVALRLGRGPSVLSAFASVAAFDFFCVPPRMTFAVSDAQYLVTFAIMLAIGLITGQLTAGLRYQARVAAHREARAQALYEFARELSSLLATERVVETAGRQIGRTFHAHVVALLPDAANHLVAAGEQPRQPGIDFAAAQAAYEQGHATGNGTATLPTHAYRYVPLRAPMRTRGVLAVLAQAPRLLLMPEQQRHLDTLAALTAIALERVHYVKVAQAALVRMESERLRNSLLAALSHDLRTPVAALIGLAESLALSPPPLSDVQAETSRAIVDQARRMSQLIDNLLEMARLQSGEVHLKREWQSIEEVVGSALRFARPALRGHRVDLALQPGLPLVEFDAILVERVLYNLLENAGKHTPPGSTVRVAADVRDAALEVCVSDDGPGVPRGHEEAVFEKFVRVDRASPVPGVGLGLAISRAIVEAHGGRIGVARAAAGGAQFCFTLPLGEPPAMPSERDVAPGTSTPAPAGP
jgi:two-component system, OmpR family, sensor histidine kinase KdpD